MGKYRSPPQPSEHCINRPPSPKGALSGAPFLPLSKTESATYVTSSKVKQGEADLILSREVVKGTDTLVLRDNKGNPVWSWHR